MRVPRRVRELHFATSLFVLVPAWHAAHGTWRLRAFAGALLATCAASLLHWWSHMHGSARTRCTGRAHSACACATLAFACVQRPRLAWWLAPLAMLFLRGRWHALRRRPYAAARWQLCLRYAALCLCSVHAGGFVDVVDWAGFTLLYGVCVWESCGPLIVFKF